MLFSFSNWKQKNWRQHTPNPKFIYHIHNTQTNQKLMCLLRIFTVDIRVIFQLRYGSCRRCFVQFLPARYQNTTITMCEVWIIRRLVIILFCCVYGPRQKSFLFFSQRILFQRWKYLLSSKQKCNRNPSTPVPTFTTCTTVKAHRLTY